MYGTLLLLITALIWGGAFLAQKLGADCIGPFSFNVYRNIIAGLMVAGIVAIRRKDGPLFNRATVKAGICCGIALWVPAMLQQVGIGDTSPGTCAFLTANYAVIVPLLAMAIGRMPRWYVWPGALTAMAGTFLICLKGTGEFALGKGEALTLLCAFFFAVQIMVVDRQLEKEKVDAWGLSSIQFLTGAILGLPFLALPSEAATLSLAAIRNGIWAILFCGVMSSGVAYTLQNVGQKLVQPGVAAIVMSLESVFGVLFGWLGWHLGWTNTAEEMTLRRLAGYALVFAAVIFIQLAEIFSTSTRRQ